MKELFSYKGRVNRAKFLKYVVPMIVIYTVVFMAPPGSSVPKVLIIMLVMFAIIISYFSFIVRRLHDLGRPGWHLFLACIPIYCFYMLYLILCKKGTEDLNKYGENPLKTV